MLDVELLEPTFGGLNFSITGNMRAGIFIKEIVRRMPTQKPNTANLLKTGSMRYNFVLKKKVYVI